MSRAARYFLSNRVLHIAQARWPWRATAIAAMLVAGFVVHEITMRTPLAAHAPVSSLPAPVPVVAPIDRQAASNRSEAPAAQLHGSPEVAEPYAADHLDAHFVDFAHPEPLTRESIHAMALTQFLGLSSAEPERHASR